VQAWKPLLLIVPAGLLLGAIGGNYARPVLTKRADDGSLQAMFETRSQRYGAPATQAAPEDATYYSGGYSYPPYLDNRMLGGDREITGWQGPSFADWPEYQPAPLPSAAEPEAQVAARDAALDQRALGSATAGTEDQTAAQAAAATAANVAANADAQSLPDRTDGEDVAMGPKVVIVSSTDPSAAPPSEPRTADGKLPAIW
jgi:hypothetical protein